MQNSHLLKYDVQVVPFMHQKELQPLREFHLPEPGMNAHPAEILITQQFEFADELFAKL